MVGNRNVPINETRKGEALPRRKAHARAPRIKERDPQRLPTEVVWRPDQVEFHEVGRHRVGLDERSPDPGQNDKRHSKGRHGVLCDVRARVIETEASRREVRPVHENEQRVDRLHGHPFAYRPKHGVGDDGSPPDHRRIDEWAHEIEPARLLGNDFHSLGDREILLYSSGSFAASRPRPRKPLSALNPEYRK